MSQIAQIVQVNITQQTTFPSIAAFNIPIIAAPFTIASVTPNFTTRTALYTGLTALAAQFGTSSPVYLKAAAMFAQNPSIQQFMVGRKLSGGDGSESWTQALTAMAAENPLFYGVIVCTSLNAEQQLVAAWVEANNRLCVLASADSTIPSVTTTDIAAFCQSAAYKRTGVFYDPLANAGAPGDDNIDACMMGQQFGAAGLAPGSQNWAYKVLAGGIPWAYTSDQAVAYVLGKNASAYITVSNVNIVRGGTTGRGGYFDVEWGLDWLQARIQQRVFGALTTNAKIPFTDAGIATVVAADQGGAPGGGCEPAPWIPGLDQYGNPIAPFVVSFPLASAVYGGEQGHPDAPQRRLHGVPAGGDQHRAGQRRGHAVKEDRMPSGITTSFVKTFDIKRVIVTFAGAALSGWADGTCIQVRPAGARWTKYVGPDGEVARAKSNDLTSEVTLSFSQTSLSLDFLAKMLILDNITNNGLGPFEIQDLNGGGDLFWSQAWIRQPPDSAYAKTIQPRVWILDTGQAITELFNADYVNLSQ